MDGRITLDDLVTEKERRVYGIERTRDDVTRDSVYAAVKDDIKNMLTSRHQRSAPHRSFYDIAPATELEKSIHEVLSKKDVDIVLKRRENNLLFDFEKKMQRFNKIKSKSFRRLRRLERQRCAAADNIIQRMEGNAGTEELDDDASSVKSEDAAGPVHLVANPVMTFYGQEEKVDAASSVVEKCEDEEFAQEKAEIVAKDMPVVEEIVLPGWGTWGGQGCDVKKTMANVIRKHVDGTKPQNRKDRGSSHVIIKEKQPELDNKYKVSLPYGYTKEEYTKKVKMPASREWTSLRVFNKFVKPKFEFRSGEVIEQFHFEPQYED